jgi:hypothetical protein
LTARPSFKLVGRIKTDRNPPRGAMVFWDAVSGGHNHGQVEISLGNGRSIGTRGWDGQKRPVTADPIGASGNLEWAMP